MQSKIGNGIILVLIVSVLILCILFRIWIGVVIVALALAVHLNLWKKYRYDCPKCSMSFQPSSFIESLTALNFGEHRKMKCPRCGFYGLMKTVKIDENRR
ncbi:MAG: hypothetical protein FWC29_06095 [Methanomassiliicoccaceae archaeon]|nr:hypothetical protein [Methanomassiliicoccaceae archaeon]